MKHDQINLLFISNLNSFTVTAQIPLKFLQKRNQNGAKESPSIHPATVVEDRTESPQHCEGEERANVQGIEHGRDDVAEEVEVRVAEVPDRGEGLAIPGDVGEPAEQDPDHEDAAVDVEPLGHARGDDGERRVEVPGGAVAERGEEEGPAHGGEGELRRGGGRRGDEAGEEGARGGEGEGEEGGEGASGGGEEGRGRGEGGGGGGGL